MAGEDDADYVCRFLAPWVGIDEDHVTGAPQPAQTRCAWGELPGPRGHWVCAWPQRQIAQARFRQAQLCSLRTTLAAVWHHAQPAGGTLPSVPAPCAGSLPTVLGPYFLAAGCGARQRMRALQLSQRPGELGVEVCGDRVEVSGSAVVVLEAALLV